MNCFDKLDKLEENLTKRLGLDPDSCVDYVYGCFVGTTITMSRVVNSVDSDIIVKEEYSKNWTLDNWKTFRDKCLLELR